MIDLKEGSEALKQFIPKIKERYQVDKICAFTYKFNIASSKALEKGGFQCIEEFVENESRRDTMN